MKKILTLLVLTVLSIFFISGCHEKGNGSSEDRKTNKKIDSDSLDTAYKFKTEGELVFTDSIGRTKIKIEIEIANNGSSRQLGLMFRKHMDNSDGMLFIFTDEEMQSFWMHETYIPLDMIFVNKEKKIVTIHRNTQTLSDQTYPSTAPAIYVIEVNARFCAANNINEGDRITFIQLAKK
ncbi:MAG: DUF192 domain-containing protein [Ignavibacteriaceae bacterium]|nr:DUF192 domain-containing protein [Ignavibacteriaceae bacterium]